MSRAKGADRRNWSSASVVVGLGEGKGKVRWRKWAWVVGKVKPKYPLEVLWVSGDITTHCCGTHLERKIT